MDRACRLATAWNAKLFVVHAIEHAVDLSHGPAGHEPLDLVALARERLRTDLGDDASNAELIVERRKASDLILEVAHSVDADLVVTGIARDDFLGTARLGSTVEVLARRVPVPLLVVKLRGRDAYRHVVVASDFSRASRSALLAALGSHASARVTLFHAFEMLHESYVHDRVAFRASRRASAEAEAREHLRELAGDRSDIQILAEHGRPEQLLADLARVVDIDLVVVGRGRGRVAALLLGSVSRSVSSHVPTDVMIVPLQAIDAHRGAGIATVNAPP